MITVRGAAAAAALALGLSAWTSYGAAAPLLSAEQVDLGGQPVESSTDSGAPTSLDPGLWTVQLHPGTQTQYFTYDRRIADSTVHVGVIGAPQPDASDGVELTASVPTPDSPDPTGCGNDYASSTSSTPQDLVGVAVIIGEESEGDPCLSADTITLEVARYSSSSTDDLPIAIKIVEEAPVTGRGAERPEGEELRPDRPTPVDPTTIPAGAASFADAPVVDPHGGPVTFDTEVTQGLELLWRVPITWGDQLVVRGDLAAVPDGDPLLDVTVQLHFVQPSRDVFDLTGPDDYSYGDVDVAEATMVAASYPLRYTNRDTDDVDPTLPGDEWVTVSVEPPEEGEDPQDVPVELTFEVRPTDAAGPTYQGAVLAQGASSGVDGYSPDTPFLVADGKFAADASGNPFVPDSESADDDQWWGPRRAVGLGVGVASFACCAVGALWLTRRRAR